MQTLSSKAERFNCRDESRLIYEIYLNKTTKHQFLDTRYVECIINFAKISKKSFILITNKRIITETLGETLIYTIIFFIFNINKKMLMCYFY